MPVTVFGGGAVQTAYVSFTALDITANSITLVWPTSYFDVPSIVEGIHYNVLAASMTVTNGLGNTNTLTLPDATESSVGSNFIITNIGAAAFQLLKSDGSELISLPIGVSYETPCLVLQNTNLNAGYVNGAAGVGATLTNTGAFAALIVDGITVPLNARVLVQGQTTTFQNGIYTLTTLGSGLAAWVLTRATDYDTPSQIQPGNIVPISTGTTYGSTSWKQTATVTTIGTDPILFSSFNPNSATANSYWVQLIDNSTAAGQWQFVAFGAGTSQAQASDLAGNGLVALLGLLNTNISVKSIGASPYNVLVTDRATLLLWQTGIGTATLPAIATVPAGFYISFNNEGTGVATISGDATIDNAASIPVSPGQSLSITSDGTKWWTLGFGQNLSSSNFAAGSALAPSITFTPDLTTGIYYYQTNFPPVTPPGIGFSVSSSQIANLSATGLYMTAGNTITVQDATSVAQTILSSNVAYGQISWQGTMTNPATLRITGTNTDTTLSIGPFGGVSIFESNTLATLTYNENIVLSISNVGVITFPIGVIFTSALTFNGEATFNGTINFVGNSTFSGTIISNNTATFNNPVNINGGITLSAPLSIANGGTGQITQQLSLNALMPPTPVIGDIVYYDATNNWVRLPIGTIGQVLTVTNVTGNLVPRWA